MSLTPRSPVRRFSQPYATPAEAWASKAGGLPGAEVRPFMGGWRVVKPPKPAPRRYQRKDTGFSRAVKLQCRTRAGNGDPDQARCECCGCFLGRHGGQVQHRLARGSGGSSDPRVSSLANAALLCGTSVTPSCHGDAESRDPERQMKAKGFVIDHGTGPEFDPRYVPIEPVSRFGSGGSYWLAEDGIGDTGTGYLYSCPRHDGVPSLTRGGAQ